MTAPSSIAQVIYSSAGDVQYVVVNLSENQNIDITTDTLVMGLSVAPTVGQPAVPPSQSYPPDVDTSLSASVRQVKLLIGDGGTTDPTDADYLVWVRDTSTPEVQWVPCLNALIRIA